MQRPSSAVWIAVLPSVECALQNSKCVPCCQKGISASLSKQCHLQISKTHLL